MFSWDYNPHFQVKYDFMLFLFWLFQNVQMDTTTTKELVNVSKIWLILDRILQVHLKN